MVDEADEKLTALERRDESRALLKAKKAAVTALLETYPAGEERRKAATQLYFDADGNPRTHHQALRVL